MPSLPCGPSPGAQTPAAPDGHRLPTRPGRDSSSERSMAPSTHPPHGRPDLLLSDMWPAPTTQREVEFVLSPGFRGGKHCDNDKADFLNVIGSNFKRICNFHNDSFLKGREHVVCQRRGFAEACTQCCPGGWGRGAPGATILWPCLRPQAVFGRQALQYLQTVPLGQICRALELRRQRLLGAARDPCPRHARAVRTRQARPSQGIHLAG